jgi:hypothetical protein
LIWKRNLERSSACFEYVDARAAETGSELDRPVTVLDAFGGNPRILRASMRSMIVVSTGAASMSLVV